MPPRSGRRTPRPDRGSRLGPSLCLLILAVTTGAVGQDAAPDPPPRMLSSLSPLPGRLELPVIDAAVVRSGERTVLLGGMTSDFEATPAIQTREPDGSWRPVGNQMLHARIGPAAIALPDGRILVWGGESGSARGTLTPRIDGELVNPRVAGSAVAITPPDGERWSAPSAPCLLGDGTVAIAAGDGVHRFDPKTAAWLPPIRVDAPLDQPVLGRLGGETLLLVSTDAEEPGAVVWTIDCTEEVATRWPTRLPEPLPGATLHPLPGGTVLATDWFDPDGRPSTRTLVLEPDSRTAKPGPTLPAPKGAIDWIGTSENGRDVLLLVSTPEDEEPSLEAYLLRSGSNDALRLWRLSTPPEGRRRMLLPAGPGAFELIGGYRFLDAATARREGLTPGAHLFRSTLRLDYGTGPVGD